MFFLSWPELHGAVTHLPIALLLCGTLFDLGALWQRKNEKLARDWRMVSFWMLVLAVAGSIPSLLSGWITGNQIYGTQTAWPAIFVWHRALAFFTSGIAILLLLIRYRVRDYETPASTRRTPLLLLSLIAAIGVGATGYYGGRMVFGSEDDDNSVTDGSGAPIARDDAKSTRSTQKPKFDTKLVQAGMKVYNSENCAACHQIAGKGRKNGPDLTFIGREEPSVQWHIEHLKNPQSKKPNSTMPSYDYLTPAQLNELATYLASRR